MVKSKKVRSGPTPSLEGYYQNRNIKMNEPDLTPPTQTKAPKAEKAPKPKKEKVAKDPSAPKKPRAPRQDYGYRLDATISILEDKTEKYRGDRKDWFATVKAYEGKTVGEWLTATKKEGGDPPRGWLRFFVQDGAVSLKSAEEQKAA